MLSQPNSAQIKWVIRRDDSKCCFIHPERKDKIFICSSQGSYVHKLTPSKFIDRLIIGDAVLPQFLVTLCEHHYKLLLRYYHRKYESDLLYVAIAHTEDYASKHPEDEFPR